MTVHSTGVLSVGRAIYLPSIINHFYFGCIKYYQCMFLFHTLNTSCCYLCFLKSIQNVRVVSEHVLSELCML